ncbi:MbnP family protein [Pedosphaera parvula]|uniref:Cytochrome-c peroxidase n=1 Tax=Pedosphaera parvula (strain Ellin514) TaxID=320771 RepID=B9XLN8_PEDPL|nr:MbnP family protein [Pedosphaera parvula]EEF59286.1 Cytochrome-c peroxidase [Pedosphaera parvula Ellin514]
MKKPPSSQISNAVRSFATFLSGCLLFIWSLGYVASAPNPTRNLHIQISPSYNSLPLSFDSFSLTNASGQTLSVTRLDLLLSDFAFRGVDGTWVQPTNSQAFISLHENLSDFELKNLPTGTYDRIRFHIGLHPAINHSNPAQYAPHHPLNPNLNGMHWGWTGGYVFFAWEGAWQTSDGKLSGYSFHLGNDPMLMTAEVPVNLSLEQDQNLTLAFNLNDLLNFKMSEDTSTTHSRAGDELAARLKQKMEGAFTASITKGPAHNPAPAPVAAVNPAPDGQTASKATPYRFTISSQFPIPDLPHDNPLTEEGVELGHQLFNEKLLSINNSQSCASCHRAEAAFADRGQRASAGAEGKMGTRNAMPIFNLAWKKSFFWDGRAASLREQALKPIENPIEMHESAANAVKKLASTRLYPLLFERAFGTPEITSDRLARAFEQFLLSQVSFNSRFDRALEGKETFTDEEKRGFELFMTEYDPRRGQFGADCFHCHSGPFFSTHGFANNGLDSTFQDLGRYEVTHNEADKARFAVPSLRNVELTGPYMHDGRFKTLEEVIEHYSTGMQRSVTLDPNLAKHPDGGVPLSPADKKALVISFPNK